MPGQPFGAVGLVLTIAQRTYAIPLAVALRLELATALDLLRQALTVAGIIALVVAGAGLLAFFVLPIPVALVVLVATLVVVKEYGGIRPTVRRDEWLLLLGEVPAAAASMLGALFYRVAIIMMSLLATSEQTGYFGLSLNVVDVLVPVATLIAGSAFPILARAADTDRQRLGFAFRQLFDVSVILGIGSAFVLVAGAEPIVAFLGGAEFEPTVPVLRIQGLAVAATFLVTLFGYMLWVVRARRQLIIAQSRWPRRRGRPDGRAHPCVGGERRRPGDGDRREPCWRCGSASRFSAVARTCAPSSERCEGIRGRCSSRVFRSDAHSPLSQA